MNAYEIIGHDGKPTGEIVVAYNPVDAAKFADDKYAAGFEGIIKVGIVVALPKEVVTPPAESTK